MLTLQRDEGMELKDHEPMLLSKQFLEKIKLFILDLNQIKKFSTAMKVTVW